jgi:predicted O-methyltransferase YrrM
MFCAHPLLSRKTLTLVAILICLPLGILAQSTKENNELDEKVRTFLENHTNKWTDLNIPARDGKFIYDLIIQNNYKSALEIGTSTGHSAIWMAWALSKTGGKLITIEIDEKRYKKALANFKEAGLSEYIDARLADAHKLVPQLKGPFDFVFCDADKQWYKKYFIDISPKIRIGGCFIGHNVSNFSRTRLTSRGGTTRDFYNYVKSLPNYDTSVNTEGGGMSVSYKRSE